MARSTFRSSSSSGMIGSSLGGDANQASILANRGVECREGETTEAAHLAGR